jgi:hypothetical protein
MVEKAKTQRRNQKPPIRAAREAVKVQGWFEIEHRDKDGHVKRRDIYENLVTDAGKAGVAGLINGVITDFFDYIAIGTGATAAAAGDTALQTEISTGGGSRALATLSRVTTTVTNDTAQFVVTFTFTSGFAVTESGVLSASSSGTLLCRQVFSAYNVVNTDQLTITWKVKAS